MSGPEWWTERNRREWGRSVGVLSVLVTCYRRRIFLREALESVLTQDLPRDRYEVVVVKDWADPAFDQEFEPRGVRFINEDLPLHGQMLARGLPECRGDVVCLLDDDDLFGPGKLGLVRDRFVLDPDLTLLRNGFRCVDRESHAAPSLDRALPQPRRAFEFQVENARGRDFRRVMRSRAYGNNSTLSVWRAVLEERIEDLRRIEAGHDGAIATLMLETGGRHRFDPFPGTIRRVGSSYRTLGNPGEAERAVRTFSYLRDQVTRPIARRYAEASLAWAKVDGFLAGGGAPFSFRDWASYVRRHLARADANTWETEAWSLAKLIAPRVTERAYSKRRATKQGAAA
jgi:glycosyltransferase involved in cell wall biosynthesis